MSHWFKLSILGTSLILVGTAVVYFGFREGLGDRVPTHWNFHGEADAWTSPEVGLLIAPGMAVVVLLLAWVLPWLSPKHFEPDRFRPTFDYVMMLVILLAGFLQCVTVATTVRPDFDAGRVLVGGIFVFFALIGNVMGQVRRNFWMGIRTPWTLASEAVWIRTHRVAAWLWTAGGLLLAGLTFLGLPVLVGFIALMVLVLIPVIYSLILYKRMEKAGRFDEPDTPGEAA